VNQHGGPKGTDESRAQNKADVDAFRLVLANCEAGTIVVLDVKVSPAVVS
jgi:hypothetical protein